MGSGTSRKTNDSVIINRPKKRASGGEGGGASEGRQPDMNVVCPPSFRVKLNSQKPIPENTQLQLTGGDALFAGQKVGSLSKSQAAMISRCLNEGFRYSGEVVSEKNGQYGVFRRR
jgi:hypothetical protein